MAKEETKRGRKKKMHKSVRFNVGSDNGLPKVVCRHTPPYSIEPTVLDYRTSRDRAIRHNGWIFEMATDGKKMMAVFQWCFALFCVRVC